MAITANRVDKNTLYSEPWNNVYVKINNRTNVPDPKSSSDQFRKFVYSREPDVKSNDFSSYPFIIINPAVLEEIDVAKSVDRKSKMLSWTIEIEVVASDRGFNDEDGKGNQYVNTISDSLAKTFNDITVLNDLKANALYKFKITPGGSVTEPLAQELVFRRSFTLAFMTKIQVSA